MTLTITPIYMGLLGFMCVMYAIPVIRLRLKYKVSLWDGGHEDLLRAIRVHGNFCEYIPLCLLLMVAAELNGFPGWIIHVAGILLITGRIEHAYAIYSGTLLFRRYGVLSTFSVIILLGLMLFVQALFLN